MSFSATVLPHRHPWRAWLLLLLLMLLLVNDSITQYNEFGGNDLRFIKFLLYLQLYITRGRRTVLQKEQNIFGISMKPGNLFIGACRNL